MPPQPVTRAKPPPAGKPAGKKVLGMSRGQLGIVGLVAAGGVIFLVWRLRKGKAAAAAGASAASSACPDGSTPDANGNCPQNGTDLAGELATLQTELADLQANQGAGGGSGGGSGTVAGSTGTSTTPAGTTGDTSAGTSSAAPSTPGQKAAWQFPAPQVQAYAVAKNGYRLKWNPVTGPAGQKPRAYTVRTWESGKPGAVNEHQATSTDTAEYGPGGVGLKKGTYHSDVWADGGPVAPPHGTTGNVTLKG